MSDPSVEHIRESIAKVLAKSHACLWQIDRSLTPTVPDAKFGDVGLVDLDAMATAIANDLAAIDAVSSQYEQVGCVINDAEFIPLEIMRRHMPFAVPPDQTCEPVFRRIDSADTRSLIDNRTPAETAEAKAWSDDAHARIQAGAVSGSHDLMREKVGEACMKHKHGDSCIKRGRHSTHITENGRTWEA